jgi:hypothetical protein
MLRVHTELFSQLDNDRWGIHLSARSRGGHPRANQSAGIAVSTHQSPSRMNPRAFPG